MKNLWKENTTKLIWVAVPLIISYFIWIVVMIYDTSGDVKAMKVKDAEIAYMVDKIWDQVVTNNTILQDKADQDINEEEHQAIINRLDVVEDKVDKIYNNTLNYTWKFKPKEPVKDTSFLWAQKK